jgi:3-deoxy-D-manno-octulosonic-acid transferase
MDRPLAWFHAPSVGEGLQAKAVLREFRQHHPHWQVAYTYFSSSAEAFAAGIGADIADCLPVDTSGAVALALDALQPSLLVFAKLDVWPGSPRAAGRDIPVALVAATVRPGSGRPRPLAGVSRGRILALSIVGAISERRCERRPPGRAPQSIRSPGSAL